MKILQKHEELEMHVLDEMRKIRVLDHMVFGGGTMLRLCFDLPRYSVDLDFYLTKDRKSFLPWAKKLTQMFLTIGTQITDEQEKHHSFLWEIRREGYPRRLKLEIRKDEKQSRQTEMNIAHSVFVSLQVRLPTLTLPQMWQNKVAALLDRNEIRDAYDLEFLTRRSGGRFEEVEGHTLNQLKTKIDSFSEQDFKVKLGGVLDTEERQVVLANRFSYLKSKVEAVLSTRTN